MKDFIFEEHVKGAKNLLKEISEVSLLLWQRGWSEKSASNFSIQLEIDGIAEFLSQGTGTPLGFYVPYCAGKCFYVTGTGTRMPNISKNPEENGVVIYIHNNGSSYYQLTNNKLKPTSELASHLDVHNLIAERNTGEIAVVHAHATELIAITQYDKITAKDELNNVLWAMQPGTIYFIPKGVGYVPYTLPGTTNIAELTVSNFMEHDIVVWQKHGAFAIGESLTDAFDGIDIICKSAKIWLQCRAAGFEPTGLTPKELTELKLVAKTSK